ncbi:MAG: hypothetical protein ABI548_07960 [Polyangiaceae bacterium]
MARWFLLSFGFLGALGACSPSSVPAARRADGSWHLKCGASLAACVQRAGDLCKDRGYVVLGGMSKRELYGAELGVSQVEGRESELDIACADRRGGLPIVLSAQPAGGIIPPAVPALPFPPASAAPRAGSCTPGATQRCVGAGACAGGQACLPDGSGYAACDCGAPPKTPNSP